MLLINVFLFNEGLCLFNNYEVNFYDVVDDKEKPKLIITSYHIALSSLGCLFFVCFFFGGGGYKMNFISK